MTRQTFYAVRAGLQPGVYHSWAECKKQTQGVSGAVFKKFSTQEDADTFVRAGNMSCKELSVNSKHPEKVLDKAGRPLGDASLGNVPSSADVLPIKDTNASEAQQCSEDSQPEVAPWLDANLTYRLVRVWQHFCSLGTTAVKGVKTYHKSCFNTGV